ncbi:MAG: hypothetical protein MZU97_07815 [Bacillus subtilis]|nr:hypothetical protein [Bacillus subtilis]
MQTPDMLSGRAAHRRRRYCPILESSAACPSGRIDAVHSFSSGTPLPHRAIDPLHGRLTVIRVQNAQPGTERCRCLRVQAEQVRRTPLRPLEFPRRYLPGPDSGICGTLRDLEQLIGSPKRLLGLPAFRDVLRVSPKNASGLARPL